MRSSNRVTNRGAFFSVVLAFLLWSPSTLRAEPAKAMGSLTINVTGAQNTGGKIIVYLVQDPRGFPMDASKILRQQTVGIDPNSRVAHVTFKDLSYGTYAATALHDENNNGKMDTNLLGIPSEATGTSNNPRKEMRAPSFDEAKFSLNASEQTINIKLSGW